MTFKPGEPDRAGSFRGGRGRWIPWMGLLLGLLSTALFVLMGASSARASDLARFENAVDVARERLINGMRNYGTLLVSTERLFAVEQGRMTPETYDNFMEGIDLQRRYPGIRGVGFAVRRDPRQPHPVAEEIFRNAGERLPDAPPEGDDVTFPVIYFAPLDAETRASLGFDIRSEPQRAAVLAEAARTGQLTLSGRLQRHGELVPGERPGFNLYLPVYSGPGTPESPEEREERLIGFLFAPFYAADFFVQGLADQEVEYEVFDGGRATIDRLLLSSREELEAPRKFVKVEQLELYGRVWTVHFHSRPPFERGNLARSLPWLMGAGVIFSVVIFLLLRRQVQAQLDAEDHLRTLRLVVNSGVASIVVVDRRTQRIVEANDAFLRMAGCTFEDLAQGRYVLTDFLSDEGELERRQDRLRPEEQTLKRPDGTEVPILIGGAPLPGTAYHEVLVGTDLSERKAFETALRESQERYELAVRATRDVIWDMDLETKQMSWSGGGKQAFGLDTREVWSLAETLAKVHPDDRDGILESLTQAIANPNTVRWEAEHRFRRVDGSYADVDDRAFVVRAEDGKPVRMVGAISDVSDRKRVESERAELLREAREGLRIRDEFLSVASHELKTPLTPLSLRLEKLGLIARREAENNPELAEELVNQVTESRRQVVKLTDLIANLLDVTRIDSGHLRTHASEVELASVVRVTAERRRPEARRAGSQLILDLESPLWGRWDPDRVAQVVDNLLSNAIKYGAGETIEVRLESLDDGRVILQVQDRGIGIAPESQPRIFDRFTRAVSGRHYGGLGLGLYVTRSMVDALGGTIRVVSHPGQGSTFIVELPHHRGSTSGMEDEGPAASP